MLIWVVRAFPPPNDDSPPVSVTGLAATLLWLEQQGYPAERVVKATDQASVTQHGDWQVLLTTFLQGVRQHWSPAAGVFQAGGELADTAPVEYGVEVYAALGTALGRLHTLRPPATQPPAGMLPSRELKWVAGLLAGMAGSVPAHLQAQYDHLVTAVQTTKRGEDLPFTLIHNDPNPDNVVVTPAGEVLLIDWESAGMGPAVLDVGVGLSNCFDKHAALHRIRHDYGVCRWLLPISAAKQRRARLLTRRDRPAPARAAGWLFPAAGGPKPE